MFKKWVLVIFKRPYLLTHDELEIVLNKVKKSLDGSFQRYRVCAFSKCIRRYAYRKLGRWIEKGPNPDLRKGKLVFSPINFLFCFRDLFGVKTSFSGIRKSNFILRAWRRDKRKRKGRKIKDLQRTPKNSEWNSSVVIFIKVYEIFRVGLIYPHTTVFNKGFWNCLHD